MSRTPSSGVLEISSPDDERIADYRSLKDRRGTGPVIVEGVEAVRALLRSPYPLRSVLVTPERHAALVDELEGLAAPVFIAPRPVLVSVVGFDLHRGAVAAADRLPLPPLDDLLEKARVVLVLEAVNDHENLGVLFRNAAAFGVDAVVLDPRTADPLYRRSVRVSMGHVLRVPFTRAELWPGALGVLVELGFDVLGLTPAETAPSLTEVTTGDRVALVLGSEATGLSAEVLHGWKQARIPMAPGVDSLNVAAAAAVALYEIAARRVASTTPMRSGPHGSGNTMGTSTPAST